MLSEIAVALARLSSPAHRSALGFDTLLACWLVGSGSAGVVGRRAGQAEARRGEGGASRGCVLDGADF